MTAELPHIPDKLAIHRVPIRHLSEETLSALLRVHLLGDKSGNRYNFDWAEDGGEVRFYDDGQLSKSVRNIHKILNAVIARGYKPTLHFSGRHWHAWMRTDPPGKADASAPTIQRAIAEAALDGCLGRKYAELPYKPTPEWRARMQVLVNEELSKKVDCSTKMDPFEAAVTRIQPELDKILKDRQKAALDRRAERERRSSIGSGPTLRIDSVGR